MPAACSPGGVGLGAGPFPGAGWQRVPVLSSTVLGAPGPSRSPLPHSAYICFSLLPFSLLASVFELSVDLHPVSD